MMERKLLVEVTEEEYEKIKDGIFEQEPKVVTEIKEVPVVMDKQFKFGLGRKISFSFTSESEVKHEGTIIGFLLTTYFPSGETTKELIPLYQVAYRNETFECDNFVWLRENEFTALEEQGE